MVSEVSLWNWGTMVKATGYDDYGTTINTCPFHPGVTIVDSSGPYEDSNNPYHLHSSDNLGLILVSHPLIGCNYNTWCQYMITTLTVKNKLYFIDGSIDPPDPNDLLYPYWNHCNFNGYFLAP